MISSHAKQENLYAVYETTERSYWRELAKCNQEEFKKSGTEGKCIEARELIIALPESFPDLYDPDKLLQMFTDRFKEKYGAECIVITTAVAVLALLISKVLRKEAELSEKVLDTKQEQVVSPEPRPIPLSKAQKQAESQIPPKPKMSASAAVYHKLHKIYKELVRQNETIFAAEKERNALEEKQGSLKGLSKLTKKGELQREIDRINERIDLLKVGLSGIAKRYGYQTVQDFYRAYHAAKNAYADYQEKAAKWEETYGSKSKSDSVHKRIQNYQKEVAERQSENTTQKKDRGAR